MKVHELDLSTGSFNNVRSRVQTFIVCENLRNFEVGDTLVIKEQTKRLTDSVTPMLYTGRQVERAVVCMVQGEGYGLETGYVVLGIK